MPRAFSEEPFPNLPHLFRILDHGSRQPVETWDDARGVFADLGPLARALRRTLEAHAAAGVFDDSWLEGVPRGGRPRADEWRYCLKRASSFPSSPLSTVR